ncbi:iron-containing alcohol dehydrogenase [Microbacterium hydrocarbonoxydans]|uniref:4-hydroxybutyrate dehydrogenase n=1 Tax=Microbacterium hydrocarbonoxydans TaxID=273678 RepID=A0A1H4KQ71_9MICO|nr:iron-containing alcohol dehydrogenase [Microbacterium hydrocarbonoxydans]SEB60641.1 4-hydroxybutyrate dehydrogenase [Microbacterium hydrocarbonoxydans]
MALIQYIGRIQFDDGARRTLPDELLRVGIRRPLVVSDRGLEANGVLATALESLDGWEEAPSFLDVPSNPTESAVRAALAVYRENGCDGVIAVGGGSPMDCGKAVALLATHNRPLEAYLARTGGEARITRDIAPIVAIPTTAGTGSEIGRGASITLATGEKEVFIGPNLVPRVAICDPELTHGLPPQLTAATGVDAFSHAFEAYLSPAVNPPADAIALEALRRMHRWLPRAVADGHDRDARWNVMMAALEAAMTTWKGLGLTHALSMPFDDLGLHHGTVVGVLLPHTVNFLAEAVPMERITAVAGALGTTPENLAEELALFTSRLGLPEGLGALGVDPGRLHGFSVLAAGTAFNRTAPGDATAADYERIARSAMRPYTPHAALIR